MNFQQMRAVREVVRRNFDVPEVAQRLHTSPEEIGLSINALETELGVAIFERIGTQCTGLSEPGQTLMAMIEHLLQAQDNLKHAAQEFTGKEFGRLTVATTHSQARYALPPVVGAFRKKFPHVHLHLKQGAPEDIAQWVQAGQADLGIATESLNLCQGLATFDAYAWHHVLVVPHGHKLLSSPPQTLLELAQYPIITYEAGFTGRTNIDGSFAQAGLQPNIVLTAMDADVIKTYVSSGLGIGIIASIAYNAVRDKDLHALPADHLFASNTTRLGLRKGAYLRAFVYAFVELFAPHLTRQTIEKTLMPPAG